MTDIPPKSRSDWASLSWKDAQSEVARLLNRYGFVTFEEKQLPNHKRADVIIKKDLGETVIIGVMEVKCYQAITRTLELSAMKQALRYLKSQYKISKSNYRWRNKKFLFLVGVIYTNDYPASFLHHEIENYKKIIPTEIIEKQNLILFTSTPNSLIQRLENMIPTQYKQSRIDDYF